MAKKYTAEIMIKALRETKGMTTLAARKIGCSVNTVKRYIEDYPTVKDAYEEEKSAFDDTVRLKMIQKIQEGDTTMIIFYAKTRLEEFRNPQRLEVTGKDGEPIQHKHTVNFSDMSDDELDNLLSEDENE